MNPELYAAMLQRLALQLVTGLTGEGFARQPDAIVDHIEGMHHIAVEMRKALKGAEPQKEAEKAN
jgi:hypothetical protein